MSRSVAIVAAMAGLLTFGVGVAEAQQSFRVNGPLKLTVRARSFLDAGNAVAPYSEVNPASAYGQMVSYVGSPPYGHNRVYYGESTLPDPQTNGPFVGARNPIGPVDYNGVLMGLPPLN